MRPIMKYRVPNIFPHSVYSPDFAPSDFFVFASKAWFWWKTIHYNCRCPGMRGKFFTKLKPSQYTLGIRRLIHQYDKCLNFYGNYIKKMNIVQRILYFFIFLCVIYNFFGGGNVIFETTLVKIKKNSARHWCYYQQEPRIHKNSYERANFFKCLRGLSQK